MSLDTILFLPSIWLATAVFHPIIGIGGPLVLAYACYWTYRRAKGKLDKSDALGVTAVVGFVGLVILFKLSGLVFRGWH